MIRRNTFMVAPAACCALLLGASLGAAGEAPQPDKPVTWADIEKAVAALADYDLGKPQEPVTEVERVLRATAGRPDMRQHLEEELVRVLESRASAECKYFICRMLWRAGGAASRAELCKMLRDEKTAHLACLAMGTDPSPEAAEILRLSLGAAEGKALVCVIGVLGDRRDEASVEDLGLLAGLQDPAVAEAALAALGRIGSAAAADALAGFRASADVKVKQQACLASLQCARHLAAAGRRDEAAAIYRGVSAAGGSELLRRGALAGLLDLDGPAAVALALATLRSDNRMMRATAIRAIPNLQGEGIAEKFAAEMPSQPAAVQALIIEALAGRKEPAVLPAVMSAARSPAPEVRTAALKALARVGNAASVPVLALAAAEGETDEEKRTALFTLRNLAARDVDAAIVESMKAARPEARAALIDVLHDRGAAVAVPALLKEAGGADAAVRSAAFKALGRLASAEHLQAMLDLLMSLAGAAACPEAEAAAVAAARQVPDEAARADAAIAALAKAAGAETKETLLRVLRGIGNPKALGAVQAALKDADPKVHEAAVRALADWPDGRPFASLLEVCRRASSDTLRVVALRGCVRMLGLAGGPPSPETLKGYADLMALARRPDEKRLVLAALGTVAHPSALALAESCLADEAVRAEAAMAVISAARTMAGTYRAEARAALEKLAAETTNAELRKQAQEALRQVTGPGTPNRP